MSPQEKDDDLADVKAAYDLLGGAQRIDSKGLPTKIFLKDESLEELHARRALGRLLRSQKPLDSLIRQLLADLFDPDPRTYFVKSTLGTAAREVIPDRQIVFNQIGRRAREDHRRFVLAYKVWEVASELQKEAFTGKGKLANRAIKKVAETHGLDPNSVKNAWKHHEKEPWARLGMPGQDDST